MSAYVVSHDTIDFILTFAKMQKLEDTLMHYRMLKEPTSPSIAGTPDVWTELGQALLRENVKSFGFRYSDADMPGKTGETVDGYTFRFFDQAIHFPQAKLCAWIFKSVDCLSYQSCEHDGWETSAAYAILDIIRDKAISVLPHYESAPWGVERERMTQSA